MAKYEIALNGGTIVAKSAPELAKKIEAEAEFWSIFKSVKQQDFIRQGYYAPTWVTQALEYIKEIVAFWPRHFDLAKSVDSDSDNAFQTLKDKIGAATVKPPYSASRVASLAKRLAERGMLQESVSLLVGSSGQQFAQFGATQNQGVEHGSLISFSRSLAAFVDLESEAVDNIEAHAQSLNNARVIEGISHDIGVLLTDASEARDQLFSRSESSFNTLIGKMKRLRASEINYFRKARTEERERRQEQTIELNSLIETFNAHLRLKRPVDLWRERNTEHNTASGKAWNKFFWGAVLLAISAAAVAVFLGGIIAESFIATGCNTGTEPQCSRISAKGPLNISLLLVVTTTWLWYLRLQMRIFLSERHLALDARERMAFAETYLALLKGAEVSRDHETVVLQSLMRPT